MSVVEKTVALAIAVLAWGVASIPAGDNTPDKDVVPCPPRGLTVDAEVIRVVDGDTVDCRVEFAFRVRLLDCYAPESRTKDLEEKQRGLAATGHMLHLADGRQVRVHIPGSDNLAELLTLNRVLGRVWVLNGTNVSRLDLSTEMVRAGHATAEN